MLSGVLTLIFLSMLPLLPVLIPAAITAFHALTDVRERRMKTRAARFSARPANVASSASL